MSRSAQTLTIGPAEPAQRQAALALAFAELPPQQRDLQMEPWRQPTPDRRIWVAQRAGRLVAAQLCQALAGNTWLVLPPRWLPEEPPSTGVALLHAALAAARTSGACLAQTLLPADSGVDADGLRAAGFQHATDLYYLGCQSVSFPQQAPATELTFEPLHSAPADTTGQYERLRRLVDATYEGTLDCPLLNGIRGTDDVLASYQQVGQFAPSRWLIVRHKTAETEPADIGCLLLAEHAATGQVVGPPSAHWELVYMGLVPAARGRGWGVQIARQAQWLTHAAGRDTLLLAVDAANTHALAMYAAADFSIWDQRSVFLHLFS